MRKVKCPTCKKETEFSPENPARPFCSDRCKLIDLGEWAEEKYKVPSQETGPYQESDDDELH